MTAQKDNSYQASNKKTSKNLSTAISFGSQDMSKKTTGLFSLHSDAQRWPKKLVYLSAIM
jgi:hypothetical protein